MRPALRARRGPITIGELTLACLHDHAAVAWPVLVSELAAGGYVTSDAELRRLWTSWQAHVRQSVGRVAADDVTAMAATVPALARTLPDDLVTRVWAAMLPSWYRPEGGYLRTASSNTAGLPPQQALGRYGVRMLIRARCRPDRHGAPIPGRGLLRCAYLPWQRVSPRTRLGIAIALTPVTAPIWLAWMLRENARTGRKRARPAVRGPRRGSHDQTWVLYGVIAATPAIAVAAWFALRALHVPPPGLAGTVIAIVLASMFGMLNMLTVYLLVLGLAMDGGSAARNRVRHPVAYQSKTIFDVLIAMFWINLPLVICIAIARLVVTALLH
jgi:hypothetical protein